MKKLLAVWQQKMLQMRLENAMVEELGDQSKRLYALEENRKMKDAAIAQLQADVRALRSQLAGKVVVGD